MKTDFVGMVGDEAAYRRDHGLERCTDRRARARRGNTEAPDRRTVPDEEAAGGSPPGLGDLSEGAVDTVELTRDTVLQHQGRGALRFDPGLGAGQCGDDVGDPLRELGRRLRRANL